MKQIALSIEQAKHLKSLGLDTSDASMRYVYNDEKSYWALTINPGLSYIEGEQVPTYNLQDILEKLPETIPEPAYDGYNEGYSTLKMHKHYICYESWHLDSNTIKGFYADALLNAAYRMLLWCIENKYIKTNEV